MEVDEEQVSGEPPREVGSGDHSTESSTATTSGPTRKMVAGNNKKITAKQLAVQQKIQQYFHRLTQGCNRENCTNPNCASNPAQKKLSGNEAAIKAIELLRQKAEICWLQTEGDATQGPSSLPSTSGRANSEHPDNQADQTPMDTGDLPTPASETVSNLPQTSGLSSLQREKVTSEEANAKNNKARDEEMLEVIEVKYLTEEVIDQLIAQCREDEEHRMESDCKSNGKDPYLPLFYRLGEVFSNIKSLNKSFLKNPDDFPEENTRLCEEHKSGVQVEKSPKQEGSASSTSTGSNSDTTLSTALASYLSNDRNGELATVGLSGLHRTGAIRKKAPEQNHANAPRVEVEVISPTVDVEAVRRVYTKLQGIEMAEKSLVNGLESLVVHATSELSIMRQLRKVVVNLNIFVTTMENPSLHSPEYLETALPGFCKAMAELPIEALGELARWWSKYDKEELRKMVQCFQQLLTYKVLQLKLNMDDENEQMDDLHKSEVVGNTVKCLKILYYASLLGGKIDKEMDNNVEIKAMSSDYDTFASVVGLEEDEFGSFSRKVWKDPLSELLGVSDKDVVNPAIPAEEFENELLNETFSVYSDFTNFMIDNRVKQNQFTFMKYPFVLNTVNKTYYFFYDNKIQMLSGRRMMMLQRILHRSTVSPYLRLKIRRDHVIDDALVRLELISNENPQDLRKQLYVEFEGEQGVDEGGVSKEFFQLVVEKIFNPDYGMFTYNDETHLFWFNSHSFENKGQFTLIGIVLGLAIYNSCILDVKFPRVVYKKLMGKKARFDDMKQSHPQLYSGLKQLLEYDGDIEEDLMVTFGVEYNDMFGTQRKHELRPDGENIPVTKENRQEYVDLYTDWLLNESIAEQFNAFRYGFDLVVAKSPIKYLFRTDELEILISGCLVYDFNSLESTTDYDGGFDKDSQTVKDFWLVVHEMSEEDKKKFLQFTTGTDRAPAGGLAQLKLIIARNGPDSDRLPTSHTCFNVILLPDYKNLEKLKERLHKAITHAKGFGML